MKIYQKICVQEYYPGGMILPGSNFSSSQYRFGFNGKEKDNEVKRLGNSIDFGESILVT